MMQPHFAAEVIALIAIDLHVKVCVHVFVCICGQCTLLNVAKIRTSKFIVRVRLLPATFIVYITTANQQTHAHSRSHTNAQTTASQEEG